MAWGNAMSIANSKRALLKKLDDIPNTAFSYAGSIVATFTKTASMLVLNPIFEVYDGEGKSIKILYGYDIDTFVAAVNTLAAHAGGLSLAYNPQIFVLHLANIQVPQLR